MGAPGMPEQHQKMLLGHSSNVATTLLAEAKMGKSCNVGGTRRAALRVEWQWEQPRVSGGDFAASPIWQPKKFAPSHIPRHTTAQVRKSGAQDYILLSHGPPTSGPHHKHPVVQLQECLVGGTVLAQQFLAGVSMGGSC